MIGLTILKKTIATTFSRQFSIDWGLILHNSYHVNSLGRCQSTNLQMHLTLLLLASLSSTALVVRLGSVLWVADANSVAQPIQMTQILLVIQFILKIDFYHFEIGPPREQGVATGLVLGANPLHLEHVRNLLETTPEVLTTLHKILDVVDVGEIDPERLEEL